MNPLSTSLNPSFLSLDAPAPVPPGSSFADPRVNGARWLDASANDPSAAMLDVGVSAGLRSIDDIERDFIWALCEGDAAE